MIIDESSFTLISQQVLDELIVDYNSDRGGWGKIK